MNDQIPNGKLFYLDFKYDSKSITVSRRESSFPSIAPMAMSFAGTLMSDYLIPIRPRSQLEILKFEEACALQDIYNMMTDIKKSYCL